MDEVKQKKICFYSLNRVCRCSASDKYGDECSGVAQQNSDCKYYKGDTYPDKPGEKERKKSK